VSDPAIPRNRTKQTELIRAFHAIEKQLASPALTDPDERKKLEQERERLGGLETYQAASVHGGDKTRGGESSKWLVKQIKDLKIGVEDKDKTKPQPKVEPTILEDGTKVWPKVERKKVRPLPAPSSLCRFETDRTPHAQLRLLDVGAIAGTACASLLSLPPRLPLRARADSLFFLPFADEGYPWIAPTSIDLNPLAPHVVKSNFFDFPAPDKEEDKFDVVALSLVVNFEGSLVNRGASSSSLT